MRFCTWRVRRLYRAGSLSKLARELVRYKVDFVIFGPRRDEVTEELRRLHNEELNDLYSSPNIVRVMKSRRMRWARHVARMVEERWCIGSW